MRQARAFFFVCAGLFLLALAYHLGARSAGAQSGSAITGMALEGGNMVVLTSTGEVFARSAPWGWLSGFQLAPAVSLGNFWSGSATPAQSISIGQLKAMYATPQGK